MFDPARISYRDLLEFFFQIHDPSTHNRQGNDVGMSYRSAIFYTSPEQQRIALDTIADVDASGLWPGKAVTEVTPAGDFWEAEPEHQDYLQHYPDGLHLPLRPSGLEAAAPRRCGLTGKAGKGGECFTPHAARAAQRNRPASHCAADRRRGGPNRVAVRTPVRAR